MNKWNCGKTIPVSSLSEKDKKSAIHEWAEGSSVLEDLLWLCHKKGLETSGCDAGKHHFAYIDFALRSDREALHKVLNDVINMKSAMMMFSFVGNPRSGPLWHEPIVCVAPSNDAGAEVFFKELCSALKKPWGKKPAEVTKQLLNIADFLKDKESALSMKLYKNSDGYLFAFECYGNSRNWDYFSGLFDKAGLRAMVNKKPGIPLKAWGIKTKNIFELSCALRSVYETMRLGWTLDLPVNFTPDMDFNSMALIMRRKFGNDQIGEELLNDWVKKNWGKSFDEISY